MGRIKKKKISIPLSLFYLKYFAYIFVFMLLLALSLLTAFHMLMDSDIVYPANYAQEQAQQASALLSEAEQITIELIPDLCDFAVFDLSGNVKNGNLSPNGLQSAWKAVQEGVVKNGAYYFRVIQRKAEYCVLRYKLSPQYKSSLLRKYFISPQAFIFAAALLGTFLIVALTALTFGKKLNKRLSALISAANKVTQQELDFEISASGIKEIDAVLYSMDNMRMALKDSLERQWKLEQGKNQQMSALAHDLKAPLTILRGNAELLLETRLSGEQKKYTEYIENSSFQMQHYVQTLIEVTRSWKGGPFHPQGLDCASLFKEMEQQARGLCTVNHLRLLWKCEYKTRQIVADHDLFIRAIINIVSNAVEHSPSRGTVSFSAAEEQDLLMISISDEGKGFSAGALKHGTEQFFMDDVSRNSKTHFGIGLYAAHSMIQKHKGQLILENSHKTGGARVIIKIPFLHDI